MAPEAPLTVTNLLKYKYLHMETNYQTKNTGREHWLHQLLMTTISIEQTRQDYQTCNVGPTRTSPNNVNTNVLFKSSSGTLSITSWNKTKSRYRTVNYMSAHSEFCIKTKGHCLCMARLTQTCIKPKKGCCLCMTRITQKFGFLKLHLHSTTRWSIHHNKQFSSTNMP